MSRADIKNMSQKVVILLHGSTPSTNKIILSDSLASMAADIFQIS
jgi:hypothetical protein